VSPDAIEAGAKRSADWFSIAGILLLAMVISFVSFPQLYLSLELYHGQPGFLVTAVAFQYGFFWESAIRSGSVLANAG